MTVYVDAMTPEQLRGECVVCGQILTEADYDQQRVVAAIGPEGVVVCCQRHLSEDGPDGPKYRPAKGRKAGDARQR